LETVKNKILAVTSSLAKWHLTCICMIRIHDEVYSQTHAEVYSKRNKTGLKSDK